MMMYLPWSHKIHALKCWHTIIIIILTNKIYFEKVITRNDSSIFWSNNNLLQCNWERNTSEVSDIPKIYCRL